MPMYDTKELRIQQYVASVLVDQDMWNQNTTVTCDYVVHALGYQLNAVMRAPAEVLMDRKLIAEYPASDWDWLKRVLNGWLLRVRRRKAGRQYFNVRLRQHRLSEHLVYPDLSWQKPEMRVRMFTQNESAVFDPSVKEDDFE